MSLRSLDELLSGNMSGFLAGRPGRPLGLVAHTSRPLRFAV